VTQLFSGVGVGAQPCVRHRRFLWKAVLP
jgi:hypothetical protein